MSSKYTNMEAYHLATAIVQAWEERIQEWIEGEGHLPATSQADTMLSEIVDEHLAIMIAHDRKFGFWSGGVFQRRFVEMMRWTMQATEMEAKTTKEYVYTRLNNRLFHDTED